MRPRYADLFRRMLDPDPEAAEKAYDDVLFMRADAIPDLIECYEACSAPPARGLARKASECATLRFYSIQLLGFTESRAALPTLVDALQDKDPIVRAEACRSLEDLRDKAMIPLLEARLDDLDEEVRFAAAEALASLRSEHPEAP
jgi:HEAT repeat protein